MQARTLTRLLLAALPAGAPSVALDSASSAATAAMSPGAHDLDELRMLYRRLIVAETATEAEGNWAGFWGTEIVLQHLDDLYKAGPFHIEPDYDREKIVALSRDVVETYVPVSITVTYGGQVPVPKPFLMILEWVRTTDGWRMATDIAL